MWKNFILPWVCDHCFQSQGWFTRGWLVLTMRRDRYCLHCCQED